MYWYELPQKQNSLVLSTRVRFARNLDNVPFPSLLSDKERCLVFDQINKAFAGKNPMTVSFGDVDEIVKEAYVETHLASRALAKKGKGSGLVLSRDGAVSVMIGEEDHIRLQVILPGLAIESALTTAKEWMIEAESKLPIAYRDGLGYLTSCPTNLGAAMRLSVMIHLPALTETGSMPALTAKLNDAGLTVRGLFGEGSREGGAIYQISNQVRCEKKPEEIAETLLQIIGQVEELEKKAKERLIAYDKIGIEDRVMRALGILKYAKRMSYSEFITHFSTVRFGRELGLEGLENLQILDRLFVELMPAPMLLFDRTLADENERDKKRCIILQEHLNERRS